MSSSTTSSTSGTTTSDTSLSTQCLYEDPSNGVELGESCAGTGVTNEAEMVNVSSEDNVYHKLAESILNSKNAQSKATPQFVCEQYCSNDYTCLGFVPDYDYGLNTAGGFDEVRCVIARNAYPTGATQMNSYGIVTPAPCFAKVQGMCMQPNQGTLQRATEMCNACSELPATTSYVSYFSGGNCFWCEPLPKFFQDTTAQPGKCVCRANLLKADNTYESYSSKTEICSILLPENGGAFMEKTSDTSELINSYSSNMTFQTSCELSIDNHRTTAANTNDIAGWAASAAPIIIGAVVVVAVVCCCISCSLIYCCCCRRKRQQPPAHQIQSVQQLQPVQQIQPVNPLPPMPPVHKSQLLPQMQPVPQMQPLQPIQQIQQIQQVQPAQQPVIKVLVQQPLTQQIHQHQHNHVHQSLYNIQNQHHYDMSAPVQAVPLVEAEIISSQDPYQLPADIPADIDYSFSSVEPLPPPSPDLKSIPVLSTDLDSLPIASYNLDPLPPPSSPDYKQIPNLHDEGSCYDLESLPAATFDLEPLPPPSAPDYKPTRELDDISK